MLLVPTGFMVIGATMAWRFHDVLTRPTETNSLGMIVAVGFLVDGVRRLLHTLRNTG
jgi:hypothetical protein